MRFLANENVPGDAVAALHARGHEVAWVLADSPGISDSEVLAHAQADDRVLLTFDKDLENWPSAQVCQPPAGWSSFGSQPHPQRK